MPRFHIFLLFYLKLTFIAPINDFGLSGKLFNPNSQALRFLFFLLENAINESLFLLFENKNFLLIEFAHFHLNLSLYFLTVNPKFFGNSPSSLIKFTLKSKKPHFLFTCLAPKSFYSLLLSFCPNLYKKILTKHSKIYFCRTLSFFSPPFLLIPLTLIPILSYLFLENLIHFLYDLSTFFYYRLTFCQNKHTCIKFFYLFKTSPNSQINFLINSKSFLTNFL